METSDREFLIGIANEIRSTGEFRIAGAPELGREILALIHQKKDLTYTIAYAGLQYAYDMLKAGANYVQIDSSKLTERVSNSLNEESLLNGARIEMLEDAVKHLEETNAIYRQRLVSSDHSHQQMPGPSSQDTRQK